MPISITDFKTWATTNQGAAVAVSGGTTLVDASTQISLFDRIFKRGAVKDMRNAAMADFTRALSVRYGVSIARDALAAAKLSPTSRLTAKKITDAVAHAKNIRGMLLSQSAGADLKLGTESITPVQIGALGPADQDIVRHFRNLRTIAIDILGETPLSQADWQDFNGRVRSVTMRLNALMSRANSLPGTMRLGLAQELRAFARALSDKDQQVRTLLLNQPLSPNHIQEFKAVWREAVVNALTALGGVTTDRNTITAINAAIASIRANPLAFEQRVPLTSKTVTELTPVVADCIKEQLKLLNLGGVTFKNSVIAAQIVAGYRQALNTRTWPIIDKTFAVAVGNRPDELRSKIVPAAQLGRAPRAPRGVIAYPPGVHGYMCQCADTDHAVNLAVSSLTVQGPTSTPELAFCGIRHGVHSAWEVPTAAGRAAANVHRAQEAVIAAFMAKYNIPAHPPALPAPSANGTINVDLDMVSVSLLTPDKARHTFQKGSSSDERAMLIDQTMAWNAVEQIGVTFQYHGQQIRIQPHIHTFNFGVNSGAVNHSRLANVAGGWDLSDTMNAAAMRGFRNAVTTFINDPAQPAAKRTYAQTLLNQCDQVMQAKGERKDSHDAYKVAARIAVLANLIGNVPCWNCKSGKDRTGEMDVECKFLSTLIARGEPIPDPGVPLTQGQQGLFRAIALEGGNFEVQKANTGFGGYKTKGVDSIPERLGGKKYRTFHAGGSKYVGV